MPDFLGNDYFSAFLIGALWTIALSVVSAVAGSIFGLLLGLGETSSNRVARWLCTAYVNVVRGIPLLVIIFFIYFGIPLAFPGIGLSKFLTGIVALSLFAAAYIAEILRGSIEAIPDGQTEAAKALGLSYILRHRYVILPQALKIALPSGVNFFVSLIKDSSLISAIGFTELMRTGRLVGDLSENAIVTYLVTAVIYFVICYTTTQFGRRLERRLDVGSRSIKLPQIVPA